jgi:hypothetical protein
MQHLANVACLLSGVLCAASPALAQKRYGPGVSDSEILLGPTAPYSGPASAYSTYGKAQGEIRRHPDGGVPERPHRQPMAKRSGVEGLAGMDEEVLS